MASPKMRLYLILEREMMSLDDAQDPFADQLRDIMDPLWRALSDEEHAQLDNRRDTAMWEVRDVMILLEQLEKLAKTYQCAANYTGPSQEWQERKASLLNQAIEWMKTAKALLDKARCYISCDNHATAEELFEALCLFGAGKLDCNPAWGRGVQDAIKTVNDEMQHYTRLHPPVGAAVVGLTAFEAAKSCLQSLLARGSYEDKSSTLMGADEHGNFPPSTKCYHGEDMIGDPEGDGRYED